MFQTVDLSETCRVLYQNKFEKQCISLAFIKRIYYPSSIKCHNKTTMKDSDCGNMQAMAVSHYLVDECGAFMVSKFRSDLITCLQVSQTADC